MLLTSKKYSVMCTKKWLDSFSTQRNTRQTLWQNAKSGLERTIKPTHNTHKTINTMECYFTLQYLAILLWNTTSKDKIKFAHPSQILSVIWKDAENKRKSYLQFVDNNVKLTYPILYIWNRWSHASWVLIIVYIDADCPCNPVHRNRNF